jgi:lipoate-protein ligase B
MQSTVYSPQNPVETPLNSSRLTVVTPGRIGYEEARQIQEAARDRLLAGSGTPTLFLLEHPPTVTLGSLTPTEDLLQPEEAFSSQGITLVRSNRGGLATYHGPGQFVGYPVLNLVDLAGTRESGSPSIRGYLRDLEEFLIRLLGRLGVTAHRQEGAPGAWVETRKIASVGVAIRRWVTMHGFALNVNPDLAMFETIRPCGFDAGRMTSVEREGGWIPGQAELEQLAIEEFASTFGFQGDIRRQGGTRRQGEIRRQGDIR